MSNPDITHAIARARDVYGSVPNAGQVLDYLEAVMAAEAEALAATDWRERALKAEAALAGGANASIAEGTHISVGGAPVAGGALDRAAAAMAAESAQMAADAERMAARAGHVGAADPLQTRIDAAVGGGLLDDIKAFVEEVNTAAAWAMPAPAQTVDLVLTIDTSAIDAALAKVEQLKVALAEVSGTTAP
ncbi:hypothetical protein NHH73_25035 [Oxalobacteraceae bacterium OTU3CINTB1]|nr:hypothetical protein NHH73_25035 [Oxalobacteraceae bacterium OTU3CINTB1]